MKKLKFIVIVLFTSTLYFGFTTVPDEQQLDICEEQGNAYGNGRGVDHISPECFMAIYDASNETAVKRSDDNKTLAFGHRNILYIKQVEVDGSIKVDVIAGTSTELESIVAVAIDDVNKEVAVLESSGDVLFFSMIITGNVAPYRVLRSDKLYGANDLVIDPVANNVVVSNKSAGSIHLFSRLANIHAIKGKRRLDPLMNISGVSGLLAIDAVKSKLFILDRTTNKLNIVNLYQDYEKVDPEDSIQLVVSHYYVSMVYRPQTGDLAVTNESGRELILKAENQFQIN